MEDETASAQPSAWPFDRRLLELLSLLEPLDQYIREVKRIAASDAMDAREKMRMIRETGSTVLTEMDRHFTAVIRETEERRRELQAIARPRRPDLLEQVQQNLRAMSALIEQVALREQLISRWERSTADDICRAYEERLSAGDAVAVELFECYAEAILQRKANATALAAFRARRERARE